MLGVERAREFLAGLADTGGGHDDGRTTLQQALHQRGGDGTRGGTRDQGNLTGKRAGGGVHGGFRDILALPPAGLTR